MNSISKHSAWLVASQAAGSLGLDVSKARPDELCLVAKLSSSDGSYTIKLNDQAQKDILSIAKGLLDRDAFIAVGMAIGIIPVEIIGGNNVFMPPKFWPDKNVFTEATSGLIEHKALEGVYWGDHTITTNEGKRITSRKNMSFRTAQQTQHSATTDNIQNGLEIKELGAPIRFGGGDENEIQIRVHTTDKTNLPGNATRVNYLFIGLYGAIIKGASTKLTTA